MQKNSEEDALTELIEGEYPDDYNYACFYRQWIKRDYLEIHVNYGIEHFDNFTEGALKTRKSNFNFDCGEDETEKSFGRSFNESEYDDRMAFTEL